MEVGLHIRSFSRFTVLCFLCQAHILSSVTGSREKRSACGSDLFTSEGIIESPNYPESYTNNLDCIWHITVPKRHRIYLSFEKFETEEGSDCKYDFLEVHDGSSSISPLLATLCGDKVALTLESTGNKMFLRFKTDGSITKAGFRAEFQKVLDCGGEITSEEGNVTSPNYPQNYGPFEECVWVIRVPKKYQINLRFRSFEIEEMPACTADYLDIHDGPDLSFQSLGKFCGSALPEEIRSSGNTLTLKLFTDSSHEKRGFSVHFIKVSPGAEQRKLLAAGNIPLASMALILLCLSLVAST